MYIPHLDSFKTQQVELHRQAAHFRLVKSLQRTNPLLERIYQITGNALIILGQSLISRARVAHH